LFASIIEPLAKSWGLEVRVLNKEEAVILICELGAVVTAIVRDTGI
jgi:hypothetical protein